MAQEILANSENLTDLASKTFTLYRTAEQLASGQPDNRLPSKDELLTVRDSLIELWNQVGVENAKEDIEHAFEPLVSSDAKERYGLAHKRMYELNNEKLPYEIKSGTEFLQMLKHPKDVEKFLVADISEYIRYSFLHSFDTYVNPPPPKIPIDSRGEDHFSHSSHSDESHRMRITDEEQNAALSQFESGEFPKDIFSKSPGFMEAYKNVLHSNAIYVIGCSDVRWQMAKGQDFKTAINTLRERAKRIHSAQQQLLRLEKVSEKYRPDMKEQIQMYERLALDAGPHSQLGIFYRSVAKRFSSLLNQ